MKTLLALTSFCLTYTAVCGQTPHGSPAMQADAPSVSLARQRIAEAVAANAIDSPGRVVVVYFTPRGRQPAANHTERIGRIVQETAGFYERELKRHGFAGRSMHLLRTESGDVDVVDVVGQDADYDKPDGRRIRDEVVPVLRQRGIDPEASVILLFCNLMDYDPVASKISHHSPYYGGGNHLSGTAWQCDSEILDPGRFRDRTPILDGEYGKITIGRHNSIFVGGVIHELGHAFSLPHCRQRSDEAVRGTALMGSGNRTYAQQLRGEGRGTMLTQAHAFRLAAHPVFVRQVPKSIHERPVIDYQTLKVTVGDQNSVQVQGRVSSNIPIHAMIAYFDPDGGGDYDATTATAVPDRDGLFAMRSGRLKPNSAGELRLVACHVNATTSSRAMWYGVDDTGRPDLAAARLQLELVPMLDALRAGSVAEAEGQLAFLAQQDTDLKQIGRRVLDRFAVASVPAALDASKIPTETTSIALSQLRPASATVGWLRPAYDRVPNEERLLSIGGDYFAQGIYAHAPARHEYELKGAWKRLRGRCGIQGSNFGRVDFEILGDGRSLWTGRGVSAGAGQRYDVDLAGVNKLTLVVGDSGNGKNGDWGVWIEPLLSR